MTDTSVPDNSLYETPTARRAGAREAILCVLLAAAVVVAAAVVGCNTIEGAGKDLKAAGEGVEKAAAKSKPY